MLVPVVAVGAVGVPVNVGDAIVALSDIAVVLDVILNVFAATLVFNKVMLDVAEVILVPNKFSAVVALFVSAVMLFVAEVILDP